MEPDIALINIMNLYQIWVSPQSKSKKMWVYLPLGVCIYLWGTPSVLPSLPSYARNLHLSPSFRDKKMLLVNYPSVLAISHN